jgi:hypothetical protein
MKKIKLIFALLCVLSLNYLHGFFIANEIYFYHWWSDVFMHFLGGMTLGLFFIIIVLSIDKTRNIINSNKFVYLILFLVVVFGGAWEFFEYFIGATFTLPRETYVIDTSIDMVMDLLGGLFAIYLVRFFENKNVVVKNE